jgi:DNA-binding beta-propeller fold protein YncE
VYVLNFGASKLQRIRANFTASTPIEDLASFPSIGPPAPRTEGNPDGSSDTITFGSNGFPAPNAMVFDAAGNLYVSDSFQGAIYFIANATGCAPACSVAVLKHDPLLATAGFPPFGANGVALSPDGSTLFIANTGDDRVLRMPTAAPHELGVFANSINGADGLLFHGGRLWVAANQADEVVALDGRGRIAIRAGTFFGVDANGVPRGLLFPASMAVADGWMYVANLALALTPSPDDEPEDDVRRWTISRIAVGR